MSDLESVHLERVDFSEQVTVLVWHLQYSMLWLIWQVGMLLEHDAQFIYVIHLSV